MLQSLTEILFHATPEGWVINGIIIVVFIWGLVGAVRNYIAVNGEKEVVDEVTTALREWATRSDSPEVITSYSELLGHSRLSSLDPGPEHTTGIGKRIQALWALRRIGKSGVEAISEVYLTRQLLHLEVPRYLTSILVLLGLAGTVWGLHGIVGHFNGVLAGNSADPMGALLEAFKPMRTAFSCTFWGIMTSILLSYVMTLVEKRQGELIAETEETLTLYILPAIFPESETAQLQRMADVLKGSEQFLRKFGETVENSRSFFAESLGDAVKAAGREFQSTLNDATQALQASLDDMRGTAGALGESAKSLDHYRQGLQAERQEFQTLLRMSAERLSTLATTVLDPLQTAAQGMSEARLAFNQLGGDIRVGHEALNGKLAELLDHLDALNTHVTEEKVAVEETEQRMVQLILDCTDAFTQALEAHRTESQHAADTLDRLVRELHPELLTMPNGEHLGQSLKELSTHLSGLSEGMGDVGTQLQTTNNGLQSYVKELGQDKENLVEVNRELRDAISSSQATNTRMMILMTDTLKEIQHLRHRMDEPIWKSVLFRAKNGAKEANGAKPQ